MGLELTQLRLAFKDVIEVDRLEIVAIRRVVRLTTHAPVFVSDKSPNGELPREDVVRAHNAKKLTY